MTDNKSATVERAREMSQRLRDRNRQAWDELDRNVVFALDALIAEAEWLRSRTHVTILNAAMEYEFARHYDRGYKAGKAAERQIVIDSLKRQAELAVDDFDRKWALDMAAAVAARNKS